MTENIGSIDLKHMESRDEPRMFDKGLGCFHTKRNAMWRESKGHGKVS